MFIIIFIENCENAFFKTYAYLSIFDNKTQITQLLMNCDQIIDRINALLLEETILQSCKCHINKLFD